MRHFRVTQSLNLTVPNAAVPLEHYLRQPKRLVQAITDPTRVRQLSETVYHLELRPLEFMTIRFRPAADLDVRADLDGTIHLKSLQCEVIGADFLQNSFELQLVGQLKPQAVGSATKLKGQAELDVTVNLPASLRVFPDAIVEPAGNAFLSSILLTIKYRLQHQLIQDYQRWSQENEAELAVEAARPNATPSRGSTELLAD
ncbi:MAG: DUF1997 domain-containing protein [Cyanobacteria bacterium P01_H01_bin.121]